MSMPAAIRLWPGSWKTFLSAQKPSLPMSVRPMPAQLTWKTPSVSSRIVRPAFYLAHNGQLPGVKKLPLGRFKPVGTTILNMPSVICWINWIWLVYPVWSPSVEFFLE